jgi:hypothetical protein
MDSYGAQPGDFDPSQEPEPASADQVSAVIGTDERRMHVRAYNYWVSLLDGRDYPSIEDLEPGEVTEFAAHSVLLDFTGGRDNPATPYIGEKVREACDIDGTVNTISDVPSRSLLSRLTDHYLQIIANRAPVGFEAEFVNQAGETLCYRGILMPFSSDGDTIDFLYGVINWKTAERGVHDQPIQAAIAPVEEPAVDEPVEDELLLEAPADEIPADDSGVFVPMAEEPDSAAAEWAIDGIADDGDTADAEVAIALDETAGLADWLWAARETAEAVKSGEGRTRAALYRALSLAYDFSIEAGRNPDDYAELLEDSGVKAQARAPMTPIVKLVFGIDYDKARLTEFAAALSCAQRQDIAFGGFQALIESQPGGLKGLVAAERLARRPEPKADTSGEDARSRLRAATALSLDALQTDDEFSVVITRRRPDGGHEPVAVVSDPALVERAIRKAV